MLLIAISYGQYGDPFSCSVQAKDTTDSSDAVDCLDDICKQQKLNPSEVDELLVIEISDKAEPEVSWHYVAGVDWKEET